MKKECGKQHAIHVLAAVLIVTVCLLGGGAAAGTVRRTAAELAWMEWESELGTEWMTGEVSEVLPKPGTESAEGTDAESEADAETEYISGTDAESETDAETEYISGTDAEPETEPETEYVAETAVESELDLETECKAETDAESETEPETEYVTETNAEPETAPVTEKTAESATEEPVAEPETKADTESAAEPITEADRNLKAETATEHETGLVSQEICRGIHYEITGDANAFFRDVNGRLWIRSGTGLYVEPIVGSGYDQGMQASGLQEDGVLEFCLRKTDSNGKPVKESGYAREEYFIDTEAPKASIAVSGNMENGISYAAMEAEIRFQIEPDTRSGLKSAAYCIIPCSVDGAWITRPDECVWQSCTGGQTVTIQEEGIFQIYVRTEDQVGNLAFSGSVPVYVDRTAPEITVSGVADQTANSGAVQISVECRDDNYRPGSFNAAVTGLNQGMSPRIQSEEELADGAAVYYYDFPQEKKYDDMYCLSISAEDRAGNRTDIELAFSVNRYGSVYDLDTDTKEKLRQYYLAEPCDIIFCETNIDYVGESGIFCRCDGILSRLESGTDYRVEMRGGKDSWKQYRYTVPASFFRKEGVYELLLTSGDAALNASDTGMQQKRVVFVLDRTAPTCILSGIDSGAVYETDSIVVCATPWDNTGLETVRIYHDSRLLLEKTEHIEMEQTIRVPLEVAEEWQTLQVYVSDLAGNEYWSEEIPFYISSAGEEIPPYQKIRVSARESEQIREQEELQKKAMQTASLGTDESCRNSSEDMTEESGQNDIPIIRYDDDSRSAGVLEAVHGHSLMKYLWPFGTAVFMLTIAGFILTGSKRKR